MQIEIRLSGGRCRVGAQPLLRPSLALGKKEVARSRVLRVGPAHHTGFIAHRSRRSSGFRSRHSKLRNESKATPLLKRWATDAPPTSARYPGILTGSRYCYWPRGIGFDTADLKDSSLDMWDKRHWVFSQLPSPARLPDLYGDGDL